MDFWLIEMAWFIREGGNLDYRMNIDAKIKVTRFYDGVMWAVGGGTKLPLSRDHVFHLFGAYMIKLPLWNKRWL